MSGVEKEKPDDAEVEGHTAAAGTGDGGPRRERVSPAIVAFVVVLVELVWLLGIAYAVFRLVRLAQ